MSNSESDDSSSDADYQPGEKEIKDAEKEVFATLKSLDDGKEPNNKSLDEKTKSNIADLWERMKSENLDSLHNVSSGLLNNSANSTTSCFVNKNKFESRFEKDANVDDISKMKVPRPKESKTIIDDRNMDTGVNETNLNNAETNKIQGVETNLTQDKDDKLSIADKPKITVRKRSGKGLDSIVSKYSSDNKESTLSASKKTWTSFVTKEGIADDLNNLSKGGYISKTNFLNNSRLKEWKNNFHYKH